MATNVKLLRCWLKPAIIHRLSQNSSVVKIPSQAAALCYSVHHSSLITRNIFHDYPHAKKITPLVQESYFCSNKKLNEEEIAQRVLNVCKAFDRIPAEKVTLEAHFMQDLSLDSLDHVELIMNIEDEFSFEIPDSEAEKLLRPKDIVEYVMRREDVIFST